MEKWKQRRRTAGLAVEEVGGKDGAGREVIHRGRLSTKKTPRYPKGCPQAGSGPLETHRQLLDGGAEGGVLLQLGGDLLIGVHDGGVIPASELFP